MDPERSLMIVGGQWGDEGKGKVVDLLSARYPVVIRYNGGHNAGHTVRFADRRFALHLVPSGVLNPGKTVVLGIGMVVDLSTLFGVLIGGFLMVWFAMAGSLAMFLASWVVVAAFTALFQPARPLVQSLMLVPAATAGVAATVELLSPLGLDNLTVPLLATAFYWVAFII